MIALSSDESDSMEGKGFWVSVQIVRLNGLASPPLWLLTENTGVESLRCLSKRVVLPGAILEPAPIFRGNELQVDMAASRK